MSRGKSHLEMYKDLSNTCIKLRDEVIGFEGVFDSEENANKFEELIKQQVDANFELISFLGHSDKIELIDVILHGLGIRSPEYLDTNINLEVKYE